MHIRVGLEKGIEGRVLAWALDYPGCFAYGEDDAEVMIRLPLALLKYEIWIKDHTDDPWVNLSEMDFNVVDIWHVYKIDEDYNPTAEGYEVNAWFRDDWRPLSHDEIVQALMIFQWQREELLAGISTLPEEILNRQFPGQRWNILGIAKHVANAEIWYLNRMGFDTPQKAVMPINPIDRLRLTQSLIEQHFPAFEGLVNVLGIDGEFWSYRKVLRRTLWHQRDHIEHIKELAFQK